GIEFGLQLLFSQGVISWISTTFWTVSLCLFQNPSYYSLSFPFTLTSSLSERTVARRLAAAGATKKLLKKGAGSYRRWEQLYVNDLWHGDTSHGIWLRDPEDPSKPKKTKFIVFVDDASRVCTHGEFYFDEQLPKLVDCFGKALLQRGRPCRLLFDNADSDRFNLDDPHHFDIDDRAASISPSLIPSALKLVIWCGYR
ncbi:MAG: hypothetical protein K2X93_08990, partial [Candidatus Obscuribacterales bacterium]|nr:hypothetical protein [Candidatus Obscuribacterales bacterium]